MNKVDLWTRANGNTRRDVRELSEEFRDELGKMSGRCLDIGSGPGDVLVDFILPKLDSGASIVCSDISEKMVNFGKERYKDNRRVSFIKLDIESLDLPNDQIREFDHVMSTFCFHWCQDIRQALGNVFNLLRPGGTAFFAFMADVIVYEIWDTLANLPQYQPYMKNKDRHITKFRHDKQRLQTLQTILDTIGFEVHHCSLREISWIFNTTNATEELLLSVDPFIDGMPPDLKELYKKDLIKYYPEDRKILSINDDNEPGYSLLYYLFVVHVTKPVAV